MDSQQFIQDALRTESKPEVLTFSKGGTLALLHLLVAAAEVADTCKRAIFYGKPLDKEKLVNELYLLEMLSSDLRHLTHRDSLHVPEDTATVLHAPNLRLLHASVGIFGESGEMLSALIGQMESGELDKVNFGEELGDVDWYKAIAHDETGLSEEALRAAVIAKLKARYGDKFTTEAATERDLAVERAVLEEAIEQPQGEAA